MATDVLGRILAPGEYILYSTSTRNAEIKFGLVLETTENGETIIIKSVARGWGDVPPNRYGAYDRKVKIKYPNLRFLISGEELSKPMLDLFEPEASQLNEVDQYKWFQDEVDLEFLKSYPVGDCIPFCITCAEYTLRCECKDPILSADYSRLVKRRKELGKPI